MSDDIPSEPSTPTARRMTAPQNVLGGDPAFLAYVDEQIELVAPTSVASVASVDYDAKSLLVSLPGLSHLVPLDSEPFRKFLNRAAKAFTNGDRLGYLSRSAYRQVLEYMCARAADEAKPALVFKRVAWIDEAIWVDLSTPDGLCIKITADGWTTATPPKPIFVRMPGQRPLPIPVQSDDGETALRRLVPPGLSDDDLKLLTAALIGMRIPSNFAKSFSYPILVLVGEAGSGKSTLAKLIAELIDNNVALVNARPGKAEDLWIVAQNRHLLSFDNIDSIRGNLSDTACQLSTGAAQQKRSLFTDEALTTLKAHVPQMYNGIAPQMNDDFLDRCITLRLSRIERFDPHAGSNAEHDLAAVQGYLCDLLVCALANLATTELSEAPRLALVAKFATAAKILGAETSLVDLLAENQREALVSTLEDHPVIQGLIRLLQKQPSWHLSMGDLHKELTRAADETVMRSADWPATSQKLSNFLRDKARLLSESGIDVSTGKRLPSGRQVKLSRNAHFPADELPF